VTETLALMRRPADSRFDETLAREVAVRENLNRVVVLGIARVDSVYVLTARLTEPASGRDLFASQERATTGREVLPALDRLLIDLRRASGEPRDSLRMYAVPLPRVTTGSLAALQSYATALREWRANRYPQAHAAYLRAIELDSTFTLAWVGLADFHYVVANDRPSGDAALERALANAGRLTERERLRLELTVAMRRGFMDEQIRIAELLARRFPERDTWFNYGTTLMQSRRCREAIPALQRAVTFDSTFGNAHINVATCQQFLGAYDLAVAAYGRAHATDSLMVYSGALNHEFGVGLVRAGLLDSARRVYGRMTTRPEVRDRQYGERSLGFLTAYLGRYGEAVTHFDSAALLAGRGNVQLSGFRNRVLQAEHLLTRGDGRSARIALDSAWAAGSRIPLDPAFAFYAGLAYLRAGQSSRAAAMLEMITRLARPAFPGEETLRAILAARIALARGRSREARDQLALATDTTRNDYRLAALSDVFRALGHPDSALAAATSLSQRAPFGTDAQDVWLRNLLLVGRLAEQMGQRERAHAAYARLVSMWRSGDTALPILVEARRGSDRTVTDAATDVPVRK
jgi:tetratricopeptide (TPR) repeat protein